MASQGRISDNAVIVATIDPDAYTANTYITDGIDMSLWDKVLFIIAVGVFGTGATVDFTVKGDTASGGSYTTTITGKAITQLTEAGTDADKQVIVEVTQAEVQAQSFHYIRGALVLGTEACDLAVIALGFGPNVAPATDNDLASVDEYIV